LNDQTTRPARPEAFRWLDVKPSAIERLRREVSELGFGHLEQAFLPAALERLRQEAVGAFADATHAEQAEALRYRASIGACGRQTMAFLSSAEAESLLDAVFGGPFTLAQEVSCITFYGAGDHLGPHLDEPADRCAVTILIYLDARSPMPDAPESGLNLRVYGRVFEPGRPAAKIIPTRAGTIVLGRGSRYWHERPPLRAGERVIAITGCYAPTTVRHVQA
jgi:hypothetical protein